MPLKKGKKGKGKKGKKGKKGSKSKDSDVKGKIPDDIIKLEYPVPPPLPTGEALLNMLKTREVEEKELYNHKMSTKILELLSPADIKDLKQVFDAFDSNSDGFLLALELRMALRVIGFNVSKDRAKEMASQSTRIGFVSLQDFLQVVIELQGDNRDDLEDILKGFDLLDIEQQGVLGADELKRACRESGLLLSHKEILDMIDEADYNGDGKVDKGEFVRVMRKTNLF